MMKMVNSEHNGSPEIVYILEAHGVQLEGDGAVCVSDSVVKNSRHRPWS